MNVIVFASRKGGAGKSTLAAHLAAHCFKTSRSCLLVDADPQGSLTLWHGLRKSEAPWVAGLLRTRMSAVRTRRALDWFDASGGAAKFGL